MINPDNFYRDDEYYFNPVLRNSPEGERLGYKAPEDDGFLRELGQGLVAGGARTISGFEKTLRGDNIDPDYETELDKFLGRNPQLQAARDGKFSFGYVGRLVGEGTATSAAGFAVSAAVSAATANPFVGFAAGLATTYGQLYGDNVREIAAMRNNLPEGALSDAEIRGLAVGVTFIQSLIERAGFEYAIVRTLGGSARRNIAQALMGKMTRKEVLELAKSATTGSALRSGSRTFISGSLAEGIEEVAQLAVSDIAKMSTAGQSSFSDIKDYSDSFIAGAVGSMGIGTFTAIAQSRAASRMNEAITKMTADPFLIHNGDPESIKKTDAAIQAFKKQLTDGGVDEKLAEQFTGFMTAMAYKLTAMDMHSNKDLEITRMPEEYLTKFEVLMKDGVLTEDFIRKYQEADKAGTLEEFTKQNKETVDEMASVLIAEDELKAQAESWGIDRQVFTLYDEFQSAENKQDTQLYRAASSFLATAEPDKFGFYELDLNDPVGMAMEALTMSGPIEINGKQIANIRFDNGKVLVQEDIPQVETEGWLENSWNIQPQEKAEPTVDEEGNVQEDVGPDVYTPEELQASEDISEILYRIAIGEAKVTPDGRDFVNQALDAALESVRKQNVRPLRSTGELTSLGRKALIHAATLDVVAQYDEQPKRLQAPPPSYEEFVKSEHRRQVELDRIAFGEENADPEVEQAEVEAIVEERVGVVEEPAPTEVRDETTGTIRGAFVPRKNAEDLIILSQDYDATTLFEEVLHSLTVNNLIPPKTMSYLIEGYNKSVTDDAYKLRTDLENIAEWSKSEEVAFHENIARYVMDAVRVGERSADPNVRFMQEALAKVWTEIGGLYNPAGMSKAELTERAEIDHVEDMLLKSWVPVESKGDPLFGARRSQIKKFLDFEREELDPIKEHIKNVAKDDPIRDELIKDLFKKTNELWLNTGLFRSPMGYIAMEIPGEFRIRPNVARVFGFRDGFFEFRNYNSKFAKAYSRAISAKRPNEAKLDSIVAKHKDSFPMLKEVVDSDALEVLGLGNLRVGIFPTNEYLGRYHYSDGVILLSAGFIENGSHKFTEDDVKNPSIEDVIAHELQHAIQHLAFLVEPKFYRNASVTAVNDSENLDYRLEPEELDAEVAALRANGELDISVPPQASLRSYIRDIINDEGQDLDVERRVQLYKEATENILFQKAGTQSTAGDILDIQIDRANELLSKQFPGNLEDIAKFTERVKLGLNVLRHPTSLQEIDNAADDLKETLPKQSPGLFNVKYVEDFRRDAVKAYKQRVESIEQQGFDFLTQRLFHGTPHYFRPEPGFPHGRFRLDMMGTGEGNQAFGYGIYFARREKTSQSYADLGYTYKAVPDLSLPAFERLEEYTQVVGKIPVPDEDWLFHLNYGGADLSQPYKYVESVEDFEDFVKGFDQQLFRDTFANISKALTVINRHIHEASNDPGDNKAEITELKTLRAGMKVLHDAFSSTKHEKVPSYREIKLVGPNYKYGDARSYEVAEEFFKDFVSDEEDLKEMQSSFKVDSKEVLVKIFANAITYITSNNRENNLTSMVITSYRNQDGTDDARADAIASLKERAQFSEDIREGSKDVALALLLDEQGDSLMGMAENFIKNVSGVDYIYAKSIEKDLIKIEGGGKFNPSLLEVELDDSYMGKFIYYDEPFTEQSKSVQKGLKAFMEDVLNDSRSKLVVRRGTVDSLQNPYSEYDASRYSSAEQLTEDFSWEKQVELGKSVGEWIYNIAGWGHLNPEKVSKLLAKHGIVGNIHGGFSGGRTGMKYVVWDQNVLDEMAIDKRNGEELDRFLKFNDDIAVKNNAEISRQAIGMFGSQEVRRVFEEWSADNLVGDRAYEAEDPLKRSENIALVAMYMATNDQRIHKYNPKTKYHQALMQKTSGPDEQVFLKKTDEMKKLGDYFAGFGEISADSSALGTMSFKHLKAGYLTSNNKRAAALHKLMGKRVENHREWLDTHFGKEKARDLTDDELDQAFSMLGGIAEPKKGPSPTRIPLYDTNAYNELTKHIDAEFDDSSDPRRLKGFAKSKQEFAHMMSEIGTQRFSSLRKILDRLDNYQPDGPWKKHILNRVLDAQNAYARNMQHVMAIRNKHAENGGIPTEGFFNEEVRLSDRTYKNSEILGIYLYARQLGEDVLLANNKDDRRWSVTQEAIDFAKKAVRENKELSNYVAFVDEVLVERRGAYDTASRLIRNKKLGVVEKHYFPVVRDSGSYVDEEKILQKLGAFNKHAKLTLEDTGKKAPGAMEEREYYRDKNGNPIVKDAFILDAASIFTNYVNSMERFATYGVARDEIANMLAISDDESAGTSPLAHLMYQKGLETEYKTLLDHVGALINPGRSLAPHGDSFGRALQTHVQHASMAFLGTNFSTVVKQAFSMPNALGLYDGSSIKLLPKVLANYMSGIYHTKAGLWGAIKRKGSNFAGWDAYEKMAKYSPALASRMFDPDMMGLHRSAREGIMERVLSKELPGFKQNAKQLAFNGIRVMDGITVTSIWNAIVDGEIAKAGVDNEVTRRQAARIAEDIILQTQPPTDVSELNLWQRGTPLEQSLTPFSGYLMKHFEGTRTMISSATADWRRAKKLKDIDPEEAKRYRKRAQETASKRFFWHIVAPAMMLFMLNKGRPPEDEEEFLTAVFAGTVFSAPIVGGSLAGAAQGYSPEIGSTTWGRMMDASIETMSALYEAANGEPLDRKDARQMSEAFSLVTGTPYALFNMYFRASEGENIPQILGLFRQSDEDN